VGVLRKLESVALLVAITAGCAADESEPACVAPSRVVAGRCLAPGVQDDGCPAGTLGQPDGSCREAGVPPELCGAGFEPDGMHGCAPVLPADPCPAGLMAVPGETACHPVMDCGGGTWGNIPVEPTTVYVDAFYAGGANDGSAARPFTSIVPAVAASAPGAMVAIARGDYHENVVITGKAVRLWGKCPGEVDVFATGAQAGAIVIRGGADGTEVHGLGVTGTAAGIVVSGSIDVLLEQVRMHDTSSRGLNVQPTLGPTSVTLRSALVERTHEIGVYFAGPGNTMESVVVRGTLAKVGDQILGRGVGVQIDLDLQERGALEAHGVVVDDNIEGGVVIAGADALLEALVVRRTAPQLTDQGFGMGVAVVEEPMTAARSNVTVRGALIEANHDTGVLATGSDLTLEGVVVRDTAPQASTQLFGQGIVIQAHPDTHARSTGAVRHCLVEANHDVGVIVSASDVTLEGVLVRAMLPRPDGFSGHGIAIVLDCLAVGLCAPSARANATVRGSLVEDAYEVGLIVGGSDAVLEGVAVRRTITSTVDASFGDGIAVADAFVTNTGIPGVANATLSAVVSEDNARSGLGNWGGSVTLGTTALRCNGFELDGEIGVSMAPFDFENAGGNGCGCPDATGECVAQSQGLAPPTAL
jgi:hypothetical protein